MRQLIARVNPEFSCIFPVSGAIRGDCTYTHGCNVYEQNIVRIPGSMDLIRPIQRVGTVMVPLRAASGRGRGPRGYVCQDKALL